MVSSSDLVQQATALLKKCDGFKSFSELQKVFDGPLTTTLHTLLHLPLVGELSEQVAPSASCHPLVGKFRDAFIDAEDDVYFLMLGVVAKLVKEELKTQQGRGRGAVSATRDRKRTRTGDNVNSTQVDFSTNVYTLIYGREQPDAAKMNLRWGWLADEKEAFMGTPEYTNSNASERKGMHLHTVLSVFSLKAHRHAFTSLWTSLFGVQLHPTLHTHLLTGIGRVIMPHLTTPLSLADYLTSCFRQGGLSAVLALEGMFLLIVDHGLEYPDFYDQLYSLIDADCFSTRHRNQLFKLVDTCLTSVMVPSYIAASFIKRTARVALLSPTPVLYFALPFLRHLLQRHPNCLALIHRSPKDLQDLMKAKEAGEEGTNPAKIARVQKLFDGIDPFKPEATKLSETHALDSTLWELALLEAHFVPAVGLMVSAYTSPAEDKTPLRFDKTYSRLFVHEITKKIKPGQCMVAYEAPPTELLEGEADKGIAGIFKLGTA